MPDRRTISTSWKNTPIASKQQTRSSWNRYTFSFADVPMMRWCAKHGNNLGRFEDTGVRVTHRRWPVTENESRPPSDADVD